MIDTNLFISALIRHHGYPYALLQAWRSGIFILVISDEQQAELADVLNRFAISEKYGISNSERIELLLSIDFQATKVNPSGRLPLTVRDAKDENILATALEGEADYLVTGDNDLLVLRDDPELGQLKIVTAKEFLDLLSAP